MWSLEFPEGLLFLLIVPFLIYSLHFKKNRGGILLFSFQEWQGRGFSPKGFGINIFYFFSYFLFWSGYVLLVLALSGPVLLKKEKVFLSSGLDIMILLDESESMIVPDVKPENRFSVAKSIITEFIAGRENDRIGLVSFCDNAVLRIPVTTDYQMIYEALEAVCIMELGDGTAIGEGIALAIYYLQLNDVKEKVIILLTDGENNSGEIDPEEAAYLAKELGIRIYTVGIGNIDAYEEYIIEGERIMGVLTELVNPLTGEKQSKLYTGHFNEELLQNIAEISGAKYFHATSAVTMKAIFEQIDSLEKTEHKLKFYVYKQPVHNELILAGFIFILISLFSLKILIKELI